MRVHSFCPPHLSYLCLPSPWVDTILIVATLSTAPPIIPTSCYGIPLPCYHFVTHNQLPFLGLHFISTCDTMSDQSRSTRCPALFESALQTYEKNTGISLPEHPITLQLENCHSVESITAALQTQLQPSSDVGGSDRVKELIRSTISILSTLSTNVALDCALGLVRRTMLMSCSTSPMPFADIVTRKCNECWHCNPIDCMSL